MVDVTALLQTMHAFRKPPPPGPVVPFLVMLGAGVLGAATLCAAAVVLSRRRAGLRRSAEAALAASRPLAPRERLAAQAVLLRRLVRVLRGDEAARAQGGAWLQALDGAFATRFFTEGAGQAYGDALYRPGAVVDLDGLDRSLAELIHRVKAP